ncbi:MarR family winged helix-turn-helix transcriptional regulator [Paenibacillus eucommiae]|uniref:DNA-binding MarR family transcriptional regulator n=1 Tax=Paenibacillus eucommiae TaxID=1355755 RepID=A0ABS4IQM8_9BACL|nr:MarR family winged helix-turn-helix transcriptional regulator [Paenibacillus eucommiae]MBP1989872.1 DNA-binding MarR family transcriptional regulator [Paenibacillus eucommiae]
MNKSDFFHKIVAFTNSVHQVTHEFAKNVKSDAITPVQYSILEYLAVSQPVTLSQISDCQHMSMPNTSRELKKLSEKHLCEKFEVAEDRRKQYIRLSKAGETMMNEAFKSIEGRFLQRLEGVSEKELEEIEHALDILHSKLFYSGTSS